MSFQETDKDRPRLSIGFGTGITTMQQLREAEQKHSAHDWHTPDFNPGARRSSIFDDQFEDEDQDGPDEDGFVTIQGLRVNPRRIYEKLAEEEEQLQQTRQEITIPEKDENTSPVPARKPLDSPFRPPILEGVDNQQVLSEVREEEGKPDKNNFMFKDTAKNGGKITVAGGILLNTVEDAKKLPFTVPDDKNGRRRATEVEIEKAFRKVEAVKETNVRASAYNPKISKFAKERGLDDLELPAEIAQNEFNERVRSSANELRRKIKNFDDLPTGSKRALLDMEFNLGINFNDKKWPNLFKAIQNQDWAKAARESNRDEEGHPGMPDRNERTKRKFLEALKEQQRE